MPVLVTAILLFFFVASASGQDQSTGTGNDLLIICGDGKKDYYSGYCAGYFVGVLHSITAIIKMLQHESRSDLADLCNKAPNAVNHNQLKMVVIKYLKDHPEQLHLPQWTLVVLAVREAFPCR